MNRRTSLPPAARLQPGAIACAATAALMAMAAASLPATAQAQAQAQAQAIPAQGNSVQATRSYTVPAGTLEQALNEFGRQAGVLLTFSASTVAGQQSAGLQGTYTVEQGFATLLGPSGLQANRQGNGSYTLRRIAELSTARAGAGAGVNALPEVVVTAGFDRNEPATENTGSYTTGVTSTATKMNLSIRETPQSISVITRQRIDDQDLTSITKVLEQTPGVTISRDAAERFNIYSRGSQISKYQFDGITTHLENATQNLTQQLADMSIYDKVEVVRGATGLLTGAGVPSGVVNLVRKKPTREFQASVEGSVGRWDDYRGQVDVSGPLIESGRLRARLVGAKQDNDTFTDYYSQKRDVLYGVAESDITDTTIVRFGIDYQKYEVDGQTGVPVFYNNGEQTNLPRSTTVGYKYKNQELETTNYFFNIDQALGSDWKLVMAGGYMDVDRDIKNSGGMLANRGNSVDKDTGDFRMDRIARITNPLNQKSAAINLQGPFSLFGREHQAIVGYEFSRYKSHYEAYGYATGTMNLSDPGSIANEVVDTPDGELDTLQDYYIIQRGYYAALRLNPVEKLHVIVGARVSDYKYDNAFSLPSFNWNARTSYSKKGEVTPYAGLTYDLTPEHSVYASYTDIFTPNNVNDINGKVIDPQVGANYEMGWKGEFYGGRLNANAAIYQIKRDNATQLAGYNSSNIAYYEAINGMKTKGIDLEISGEVLPGWNVSASYSHSKSKDGDGVRQEVEHPVDTVKLWNTYRFSGGLRGLTIGGGARWQSRISTWPITVSNVYYRAVQDDYVVVDLMARYRFSQNFSATLNINNLFDKKYYSSLGSLAYAYYGAPRNVRLGLRYDF